MGQPPSRIEWANALRGLAAVSVVLGAHLTVGLWLLPQAMARNVGLASAYGDLGEAPWWLGPIGLIPWSAVGVSLFFLISGLVVPLALRRQSRIGFGVGRLLRILPTYAVGYLIISAIYYLNHRSVGPVEYSWSSVLVGTIPGLDTLLDVDVISNGVAWTLVVEMSFYTICVVFYRSLLNRWWLAPTIGVGILILNAAAHQVFNTIEASPLAGATTLFLQITPFLPVVLIGSVLTRQQKESPRWQLPLSITILSGAFWMLSARPLPGAFTNEVSYRLPYLVMIGLFVGIWLTASAWRPRPVADFFANISYSLYVTHFTVGVTTVLILLSWGTPPIVATAGGFAAAVAVARVLYLTVERPTHRWARRAAQHLSPAEPETTSHPEVIH